MRSIYNGHVVFSDQESDLHRMVGTIDDYAREFSADEISLKIGYASETTLHPALSLRLLQDHPTLPFDFSVRVSDYEGFVDLSLPFDRYLHGLKSGYREFFQRGNKRQAYRVSMGGKELSRELFDAFIGRLRQTYMAQGYNFKWPSTLCDALFGCFRRERALLCSVQAIDDHQVFADIMVLHDNVDAYYYSGARQTGAGLYKGVAHFAQAHTIQALSQMGLGCYSLGYVGPPTSVHTDSGVREFKRAFATHEVPVVEIYRASRRVRALQGVERAMGMFKRKTTP
jgi:hypothetical protein